MTEETLPPDRAEALILAYGADPARWPEDIRDALARSIEVNPGLVGRVAVEGELDDALALGTTTVSLSVAQVLANTERKAAQGLQADAHEAASHLFERFLDWLCFSGPETVWRGAVVAGLILTLGIGFGAVIPEEGDWSASEQYVFAPIMGDEIDG